MVKSSSDIPILDEESALIIFEGANSKEVENDAKVHDSRRESIGFFVIAAIALGMMVYSLIIFEIALIVVGGFGFIAFLTPAVLLCIKVDSEESPLAHRVMISKDIVFDKQTIMFTSHKLEIAKVKKVIDHGTYYRIIGFKSQSIVCEKSLLTKGSLDEFEELFPKKPKVRRG